MKNHYDVIIIGAGAAGLFCAFNIAKNKKSVLVLDHANKVGKKILMSGGGRCNFTNLNTMFDDFTSENLHFVKSALNQYTAYDFLALVEKHNIEYVEKGPGQLFCKNSSKDILKMLLDECANAAVKIFKKCEIKEIKKETQFEIGTSIESFSCESLVIATGGLSIPSLGASGYGYTIAEQFGHEVIETNASLVPFILPKKWLNRLKELSGVSLRVSVSNKKNTIEDDMLFTHRGLSGPAILKLSAYWNYGEEVVIDLLPSIDLNDFIKAERLKHPEKLLINSLSTIIPKRLVEYICVDLETGLKLKQLDKPDIEKLKKSIHSWIIIPSGTEGYRTAEVTSGGVSTEQISSKTFESKIQEKLFFIGEVLDVTGQLGGYNFQWAWSSAWCAAQAIKENDQTGSLIN